MQQSTCCLYWLLGTSVHACKSQDIFIETLVLCYTNQSCMEAISNEGRINNRNTLKKGNAECIPTYCTLESEK